MSDAGSELQFESLEEFYRFYLGEHRNGVCRALHFVGTTVSLGVLVYGLATQQWWIALLAGVPGYLFAWIGHFGFEKNKPATFKHPLRSFICDWIMWRDILAARVPLLGELPHKHYVARS